MRDQRSYEASTTAVRASKSFIGHCIKIEEGLKLALMSWCYAKAVTR